MVAKSRPHTSCPTCKKEDTWLEDNKFRPFCCARCKLIDLGEWAGEERRIPGEKINPENFDPDKDLE